MWGGSIIDQWDESVAAEEDAKRVAEPLTIGASLAFGDAVEDTSLAPLAERVKESIAAAHKFYGIEANKASDFVFDGDVLTFRIDIVTETEPNNIVYAKVYEGGRRRSAVVVLPHLNAETWGYQGLSQRLMRLGLTVVELTLPYHSSLLRLKPMGAAREHNKFLTATPALHASPTRAACEHSPRSTFASSSRGSTQPHRPARRYSA